MIDAAEAEMLIGCGVHHLGFPLVLGYHEEDLSVAEAATIVAALDARATFFLITYLTAAEDIVDLCRRLGVAMVQLHGEMTPGDIARLRSAQPDLRIVKSLIVGRESPAELAVEVAATAAFVDAFITDTYDAATGASGATGKVHDWQISRHLVEISPKPVILAGGLNSDNVAEAIRIVRPAGVDVHTGIEGSDGRKHPDLTRRFVAAARQAFGSLAAEPP